MARSHPYDTTDSVPDAADSRWARRWIGSFVATTLVLAAAGTIGGRLLGWLGVVACLLLGVVTLVTQAVVIATDRSRPERKHTAIHTARWVCAASAAVLATALIVQAIMSTVVGTILIALSLLTLLGAALSFLFRW